jgi:hypothetical protein
MARFGTERILQDNQPKHCVVEGAAIVVKVYQSVMCPNPACEHDNDLDATVCSMCGTLLNKLICTHCGESNEPGVDVCRACGESLGRVPPNPDIGMISSCDYFIQYSGDQLAVFVKKGDPIPTPPEARRCMNFRTLSYHQRMILLPVYTGDTMERATPNSKQADILVELPSGLSKDTIVSVSLWLDQNATIEVKPTLEDGTELTPIMMVGGGAAAVVRLLEELERLKNQYQHHLSAEMVQVINDDFDAIFEKLNQGQVEEALEMAEYIRFAGRFKK